MIGAEETRLSSDNVLGRGGGDLTLHYDSSFDGALTIQRPNGKICAFTDVAFLQNTIPLANTILCAKT